MRTLFVLMLCGALLIAQEVGLLARLQEETRVIAAAADEALVAVDDRYHSYTQGSTDLDADGKLPDIYYFTDGVVSAGANTHACPDK